MALRSHFQMMAMFALACVQAMSACGRPVGQGDHCPEDPDNWSALGCAECIDEDGDGLGLNCDLGRDCDDSDPTVLGECLTRFTALSANKYQTCALRGDGTVWCWGGENSNGALGDGTTTQSTHPVQVSDIDDAVLIAASSTHSCVVRQDGSLWCWGGNEHGQIGDGTTEARSTPVPIPLGASCVSVATGSRHTCAVTTEGDLLCWGWNRSGQLGIGNADEYVPSPTRVTNLTAVTAHSAGGYHHCAVLQDSSVWCWGNNSYGQVGDGSTENSSSPTQALGIQDAVAIEATEYGTCVVDATHRIWCWGYNSHGQIGDRSLENRSVPTLMPELTDVAEIHPGGLHTCALQRDRTVRCWGSNDRGQLCNGNTTGPELCWYGFGEPPLGCSSTPLTPIGIGEVSALAVGETHNCVIVEDGTIRCWGYNERNELGVSHDESPDSCLGNHPCSTLPIEPAFQ